MTNKDLIINILQKINPELVIEWEKFSRSQLATIIKGDIAKLIKDMINEELS